MSQQSFALSPKGSRTGLTPLLSRGGVYFLRAWPAKGLAAQDVPDDFDLLTEGVIDSLGIVQMIAALDAHFGVAIDLEELDPEQLTVIDPLCRYVAAWISNITRDT